MAEKEAIEGIETVEHREVLGHPKGLFYLFFAEMWERFSFYGMRALLVLYLSTELFKDLMNGEEVAFEIYAAYGSLVYFTPAIGGMLADRVIGHKNSIVLGGLLMCIGHFTMAFENETIFYISLGLLIIGNGFFKPNISSLVGGLYKEGDKKRDVGFTIFYMGINLGAFLSPLVCGWLGKDYGWHYGFGAAGVGMALGLVVFWRGIKQNIYGDQGNQPEPYRTKKFFGLNILVWTYIISFLAVPLFAFLVSQNSFDIPGVGMGLMEGLLWSLLVLVIVYLIFVSIKKLDRVGIQKLGAIVILTFFITVFWSFFEQAGSSLTLFAERNVNLVVLNAAQTNSINAGYIVLLAIPFGMMWTLLSKKKLNPIAPVKFALGIFQLGLGFLIFALSAPHMNDSGLVPMVYLMIGYLLVTTGELFASPIGLSKVTQLSPAFLVSFMMGVWFLSSSFAHHIAGVIAKLTISEAVTEEYKPEEGIFIDFANWASGMDQNKVGQFNFDYQNAYTPLTDTAVYNKKLFIEVNGEERIVTAGSFSAIDKEIAKLKEEKGEDAVVAKDTTYELDRSRLNYPTIEEFEHYLNTVSGMDSISDTWGGASKGILAHADNIRPILATLQDYTDDEELVLMYFNYNRQFMEMVSQGSFKETYELLKDHENDKISEEDFEKAMEKVSKKWKLKAETLIAYEKKMIERDHEWATTSFAYNNMITQNNAKVKPIIGLATYTKVFAQIALLSFLFAALALLLAPLLKRWMHGVN